VFSILIGGQAEFPSGTRVLDAFAGTGALGMEALSRGADFATFMDMDPSSLEIVSKNIRTLGEEGRTEVINRDVTRPGPAKAFCNLVFLDPPYGENVVSKALSALNTNDWLAEDAVIVVELAKKKDIDLPDGFQITDDRVYGDTRIVFAGRSA